jgi:hypothetical protein
MVNTTHLSLPLIMQNQAQKELTINEALVTIDALLNSGAKSKKAITPPEVVLNGDVYIVSEGAMGTWAKRDNHLAYYFHGWRFIKPNPGLSIWVQDEDKFYYYKEDGWATLTTGSKQNTLGINTNADDHNRLSVKSDSVLFSAIDDGRGNIRLAINKKKPDAVSSILFQSDYKSHAEIGIIGDNQLQIKVSSDGKEFKQALVIDNKNDKIFFKQKVNFEDQVTGLDSVHRETIMSSLYELPLYKANIIYLEILENCELLMPTVMPHGKPAHSLTLITEFKNGKSIYFPKHIKWPYGKIPATSGSEGTCNIYRFITVDGGTSWFANLEGGEYRQAKNGWWG